MADAARYLSYSGRDPCWGCSRALQAWHDGDRSGPMPPRARRATHRRVRGGREWPLCGEHKATWEAHDAAAGRKQR